MYWRYIFLGARGRVCDWQVLVNRIACMIIYAIRIVYSGLLHSVCS